MFSCQKANEGIILEQEPIQFDMESVDLPANLEQEPWNVTISITNHHRAVIGGRIYVHVGLAEVASEVITVLPGHTSSVEFKHHLGPLTRIYSNEIVCAHSIQHGFSFLITNPENNRIYETTVN